MAACAVVLVGGLLGSTAACGSVRGTGKPLIQEGPTKASTSAGDAGDATDTAPDTAKK